MKLWRTQYYTGPHSGRSARSSPKATSNLGKPNYRLPTPRTVTFLYAPCREVLADGVDRKRRQTKEELITPHASGSSLILVRHYHVGHGRTANYLDKGRATKYVALEPNTLTYPHIRRITNQAGFTEADGSLLILSCGAEDTNLTYLDIVLVEWASST
ncbi:hypothetical protein BDN72DRAFT_849358 [Pluteus cervinus]|uniref:Uncharacterized protein n=1 Tax=Pluteus cervinus TaxID=181527 RepID=A0ACD3A7X1_9AGAR|nr:hypothetical protein BDN72DRAFT_849358 [Pluteus cervinus]